jgi:hypothetical protein
MLSMSFRFDLVVASGHFQFADRGWEKVRYHLLEFQPAKTVSLVGEPPSRIRVVSHGDQAEVAPALLARVEGQTWALMRPLVQPAAGVCLAHVAQSRRETGDLEPAGR